MASRPAAPLLRSVLALTFAILAAVGVTTTRQLSASPAIGQAAQPAPAAPAPPASDTRLSARVDQQRLMDDVRALAAPDMEGRRTGTPGNRRAQAFVVRRFKDAGLQPLNGAYEQKFSFTRRPSNQEFPDATNLIGTVAGTSESHRYVLVTAHYDHLGVRDGQVYHGADDNASGVATLLALAQWFGAHPPRTSLMFVAFDGEEQGLQGAKHFVAHPPIELPRIVAVVNLDMVSRGDKNVLFAAGTHPNPTLKPIVEAAAAGRRITVMFGHDRPGVPGMADWTNQSDHGPFHGAGVPHLYFGVEDHPDYHKPTDTADKIPQPFFAEAAELVLDVVGRLAGGV